MKITKEDIIKKANELGFEDIGFTRAEPFDSQVEILKEREEEYAWAIAKGIDLMTGTDPKAIHPEAKSIIVLMEVYFRESYPQSMEKFFGRCYLDDDRMIKDRLSARIKKFLKYLQENGIESKVPFNLPHRLAAARAGMGTFGKNCLFYSNKVAKKGSWVLPIAVTVDQEFEPDEPTLEVGCPDWCRNVCISACPTHALKGPRKIDPTKCISYLSYFSSGMTPMEFREPMGTWVYGCDHCQNVCPRNRPWLQTELTPNKKVETMIEDFKLDKILEMDKKYFMEKIWKHMFYQMADDIWRWKMNAARAMGNTLDPVWVPHLEKALKDEEDERVAGMAAWALGRIGGEDAKTSLEKLKGKREGLVEEEIGLALEVF